MSAEELADFQRFWESPERGIEALVAKELDETVLRRFLNMVKARSDYPAHVGTATDGLSVEQVRDLVRAVLEARKGNLYGYAALLIAECQSAAELPCSIRTVLEEIHKALSPVSEKAQAPEGTTVVAPAISPEHSGVLPESANKP
jgi:putative ATP-dependent endonuclease of OLD family